MKHLRHTQLLGMELQRLLQQAFYYILKHFVETLYFILTSYITLMTCKMDY